MARIEKYFKRVDPDSSHPPEVGVDSNTKRRCVSINMDDLPTDPGLRVPISNYSPNTQDQIRRHYLQQGPCQPKIHEFPPKYFRGVDRRFNIEWYDQFPTWLEYSINKDSAFCLYCYLFKQNKGKQGGGQTFVSKGFSNWKKRETFALHVGKHDSSHYECYKKCEALMNEKQQIQHILLKKENKDRKNYRVRLTASVESIRFLLRQGLAFRGHDESEDSNNQGNFLELLKFLADHNEEVRAVVLKNAPENLRLTSPKIQKDIVNACAVETISVIIKDMEDVIFSILVDESRDVSIKEQMVVMFRYVDKKGYVIERFIGIEHVESTTSISLKIAIDKLFSKHGLSISRLRGQGYDGASNMSGEFNGLKSIIMKENECAFYVHCFAHQLQLALMGVAKKHDIIGTFLTVVSNVVNIVGASSKRRDILREKQAAQVIEALKCGKLSSGKGLNQENGIKRPCETRWGSHFGTLVSFTIMFSSILDVLEEITSDSLNSDQKYEASIMLQLVQTYDFIFSLHLVKNILGITNELSQVLQKGDQDIVNAMDLVKVCKEQLQVMRDNGWNSLVEEVSNFCVEFNIDVINIDGMYCAQGKSRRRAPKLTNFHYFRIDFFNSVIDLQLQELNNRFNEANTELLLCLACLSPNNSFYAFDKKKLLRPAQLYPHDFSIVDLRVLEFQLQTYVDDLRSHAEFS
uniref:TTF-type domain-containing protein n=1 Tax=Cannabis sativa TaxID=3483 RepID=A0A803Q5F8_CANSA